jgi:protein involved in polysaccharide export with SLBB domain
MRTKILSLVLSLTLVLSLAATAFGARSQTTDSFYIAGEVGRPGTFVWKEGLTLRQAIALAEGFKFSADSARTVIFRKGADGKREEIKVDLRAVMNGKVNDLGIEADDIIVVPRKRQRAL